MAKHLHQLDLFGMEIDQPVHIKSPVEKRKSAVLKQSPSTLEVVSSLDEETRPTVSRTPMSFSHSSSVSKRGRKSFASMDADLHTLNIPASEELVKKLYYPIGEVATWFNVKTYLIRYWEK